MDGQTEISVNFEDGSSFEYRSFTCPRVGEKINVDVQYFGEEAQYLVKEVVHKVFSPKGSDSSILSYVKVYITPYFPIDRG